MRLVATADADVRVKMGALIPGLSAPEVQGKTGGVRRNGDWFNLRLLEGEAVEPQAKRTRWSR